MQSPRRRNHIAAIQQDLQRIGAGDAGAEVAGHRGRRAFMALEVHSPLLRQVRQLQHRRRQADQEA